MSLINDALKRAQSQQQQTVNQGGGKKPPPRAPELKPAPSGKSSPLPIILVVLLIACLAGGGWFFWQWYQKKKAGDAPIVAKPAPVKPAATNTEIVKADPAQTNAISPVNTNAVTEPQPNAAPIVAATNQTPPTTATKPEETATVAAAKPPEPKLAETKPAETKPESKPFLSFPKIFSSSSSTPTPPSTTRPATETKPKVRGSFPALKLQGIFYNATKPAAILNGKYCYIGTVIQGARVVQIDRESVTVEWNGENHVVESTK